MNVDCHFRRRLHTIKVMWLKYLRKFNYRVLFPRSCKNLQTNEEPQLVSQVTKALQSSGRALVENSIFYKQQRTLHILSSGNPPLTGWVTTALLTHNPFCYLIVWATPTRTGNTLVRVVKGSTPVTQCCHPQYIEEENSDNVDSCLKLSLVTSRALHQSEHPQATPHHSSLPRDTNRRT